MNQALAVCPAVAILRATTAQRFGEVTDVLVAAGIRAVEFTFTTPGVVHAIADYAERKPSDVVLGAGTVTTTDQAEQAVAAGATYLVAPTVDVEVISWAGNHGVPIVPGGFTPTEIHTAARAGAPAVKVFPASVGGPSYLKAIRGPLPDIPLVPTGGIDVTNARAYLDAGALAVGVGTPLQGDAADAAGDLTALADRARTLVAGITGHRADDEGPRA